VVLEVVAWRLEGTVVVGRRPPDEDPGRVAGVPAFDERFDAEVAELEAVEPAFLCDGCDGAIATPTATNAMRATTTAATRMPLPLISGRPDGRPPLRRW